MRKPIRFFAVAMLATGLLVLLALTLLPGRSTASAALVAPAYAEINGCAVETLRGAYIYSADGFVTANAGQAPFTPIAEAGVYTFDGAGGLSTANTLSLGGTIRLRTDTGTYTVNTDCTGSVSLAHGVSFNFAVSRSGREMRLVASTPGASVMGTMTQQ